MILLVFIVPFYASVKEKTEIKNMKTKFLDRQFSIQRREQLENTFKGRKQMKRVRTQSTDHYQYGQGINCSAANSDLCGKTRAGSYSILYCISSDSCRLSRSNTKIQGRELRSAYDYACSQCGICMFDRQYKKKHANSYQVREYPNKPTASITPLHVKL